MRPQWPPEATARRAIAPPATDATGRAFIAAVGIDRYHHHRPLRCAVSDARAVHHAFADLGYQSLAEPLLDDAATQSALRALFERAATTLCPDDTFVVFFAGHGCNRRIEQHAGALTVGYLLPVEAAPEGAESWLELSALLRQLALLPARHVLVILDSCHSGLALHAVPMWRSGAGAGDPLSHLSKRQSRRVLTSALEDQLVADEGATPGHSRYTSHLLRALRGEASALGASFTGSMLGQWLQRQVAAETQRQQTPDFGAFELDQRGELVLHVSASGCPRAPSSDLPREPRQRPRAHRAATADAALLLLLVSGVIWVLLLAAAAQS